MDEYTREYLLRVYALAERYGFEPVTLAEMGSGWQRGDKRVTAAIRNLVADGMIERIGAHGYIVTDRGKALALELLAGETGKAPSKRL